MIEKSPLESLPEKLRNVDRIFKLGKLAEILSDSEIDCVVGVNSEGIINVWNKAAERTFLFTSEEAIGKSLDIIIPPYVAMMHSVYVGKHVQSGGLEVGRMIEKKIELTGQRADGSQFPCEIAIKKLTDDPDNIIGFVGYMRDITQEKRLRAWLKKKEE